MAKRANTTAPRRGRPPLASRDQLLDAAERAIRRHGPTVSLERIAERAGVSKPVLFSHVGDRRELVRALSERLLERIEEAVSAARADAGEERATTERVIAAQLEAIEEHRHLYAFVNGGGAGKTTLETTLEFARRAAASLERDIRLARERAGQSGAVAEPWSYAIVGMMHMVGAWWIADRGRKLAADSLAKQLTELLWSGIAPRA